jgi:hypothetical protein
MTIILGLFFIFFWISILFASNFDVFDKNYRIFRDFFFYGFPVIGYSLVYIVKSLSKKIFLPVPSYNKLIKDEEANKTLTNLLTKEELDKFSTFFQKNIRFIMI